MNTIIIKINIKNVLEYLNQFVCAYLRASINPDCDIKQIPIDQSHKARQEKIITHYRLNPKRNETRVKKHGKSKEFG